MKFSPRPLAAAALALLFFVPPDAHARRTIRTIRDRPQLFLVTLIHDAQRSSYRHLY